MEDQTKKQEENLISQQKELKVPSVKVIHFLAKRLQAQREKELGLEDEKEETAQQLKLPI
jgi:hypothetical protein